MIWTWGESILWLWSDEFWTMRHLTNDIGSIIVYRGAPPTMTEGGVWLVADE